MSKKIDSSISLPCTLRRVKTPDPSCRGSNNCYVWSIKYDETFNTLSKDYSAEYLQSEENLTESNSHDDVDSKDHDFLLVNEQGAGSSAGVTTSDYNIRSRRNSRASTDH